MRGKGAGTRGSHRLRRGVGSSKIGAGLHQFALRLFDLRRVRVGARACSQQSCSGGLGAGDGLIVLLLRDFLLLDQLFVADKIILRFGIVGVRFNHLRFGGFILLAGSRDSCLRTGDTGLGAAHLA